MYFELLIYFLNKCICIFEGICWESSSINKTIYLRNRSRCILQDIVRMFNAQMSSQRNPRAVSFVTNFDRTRHIFYDDFDVFKVIFPFYSLQFTILLNLHLKFSNFVLEESDFFRILIDLSHNLNKVNLRNGIDSILTLSLVIIKVVNYNRILRL